MTLTMRLSIVVLTTTLFAGITLAQAHDHDDHDHAHDAPATQNKDALDHDDHDHDHDEHDDHTGEVKLSEAAIRQNGIRIGTPTTQPLASRFSVPARVSLNTDRMAHVGSVVKGRVVDLTVRVGDVVQKDDPLMVVESPELGEAQSDFIQKRSAQAIAEAAVSPAQAAYDRAKSLYDSSQGISLAEVQKREAELLAAKGAARSAKVTAQAAENTLHLLGLTQTQVETLAKTTEIDPKYTIRAPISGSVLEREATLGELVSPEKDALLVLADTSIHWVLADVPEARLGEFQVGSWAQIDLGANRGEPVIATVSFISPIVDPQTRTARVRIEVANHSSIVKPGMFARVTIFSDSPTGETTLSVPEEAIQRIEGEDCVFVPVPNEANTFAKRDVRIGPAVGGFVPILEGLSRQDQLVVSGTFILKAELGKSHASHGH